MVIIYCCSINYTKRKAFFIYNGEISRLKERLRKELEEKGHEVEGDESKRRIIIRQHLTGLSENRLRNTEERDIFYGVSERSYYKNYKAFFDINRERFNEIFSEILGYELDYERDICLETSKTEIKKWIFDKTGKAKVPEKVLVVDCESNYFLAEDSDIEIYLVDSYTFKKGKCYWLVFSSDETGMNKYVNAHNMVWRSNDIGELTQRFQIVENGRILAQELKIDGKLQKTGIKPKAEIAKSTSRQIEAILSNSLYEVGPYSRTVKEDGTLVLATIQGKIFYIRYKGLKDYAKQTLWIKWIRQNSSIFVLIGKKGGNVEDFNSGYMIKYKIEFPADYTCEGKSFDPSTVKINFRLQTSISKKTLIIGGGIFRRDEIKSGKLDDYSLNYLLDFITEGDRTERAYILSALRWCSKTEMLSKIQERLNEILCKLMGKERDSVRDKIQDVLSYLKDTGIKWEPLHETIEELEKLKRKEREIKKEIGGKIDNILTLMARITEDLTGLSPKVENKEEVKLEEKEFSYIDMDEEEVKGIWEMLSKYYRNEQGMIDFNRFAKDKGLDKKVLITNILLYLAKLCNGKVNLIKAKEILNCKKQHIYNGYGVKNYIYKIPYIIVLNKLRKKKMEKLKEERKRELLREKLKYVLDSGSRYKYLQPLIKDWKINDLKVKVYPFEINVIETAKICYFHMGKCVQPNNTVKTIRKYIPELKKGERLVLWPEDVPEYPELGRLFRVIRTEERDVEKIKGMLDEGKAETLTWLHFYKNYYGEVFLETVDKEKYRGERVIPLASTRDSKIHNLLAPLIKLWKVNEPEIDIRPFEARVLNANRIYLVGYPSPDGKRKNICTKVLSKERYKKGEALVVWSYFSESRRERIFLLIRTNERLIKNIEQEIKEGKARITDVFTLKKREDGDVYIDMLDRKLIKPLTNELREDLGKKIIKPLMEKEERLEGYIQKIEEQFKPIEEFLKLNPVLDLVEKIKYIEKFIIYLKDLLNQTREKKKAEEKISMIEQLVNWLEGKGDKPQRLENLVVNSPGVLYLGGWKGKEQFITSGLKNYRRQDEELEEELKKKYPDWKKKGTEDQEKYEEEFNERRVRLDVEWIEEKEGEETVRYAKVIDKQGKKTLYKIWLEDEKIMIRLLSRVKKEIEEEVVEEKVPEKVVKEVDELLVKAGDIMESLGLGKPKVKKPIKRRVETEKPRRPKEKKKVIRQKKESPSDLLKRIQKMREKIKDEIGKDSKKTMLVGLVEKRVKWPKQLMEIEDYTAQMQVIDDGIIVSGTGGEKLNRLAEFINNAFKISLDRLTETGEKAHELFRKNVLENKDNRGPPVLIKVYDNLPVHACRLFDKANKNVIIALNKKFIEKLISDYKDYRLATSWIIFERLFHELGHDNKYKIIAEIAEEIRQIWSDIKLYKSVILYSKNEDLREAISIYLIEDPFGSERYFRKVKHWAQSLQEMERRSREWPGGAYSAFMKVFLNIKILIFVIRCYPLGQKFIRDRDMVKKPYPAGNDGREIKKKPTISSLDQRLTELEKALGEIGKKLKKLLKMQREHPEVKIDDKVSEISYIFSVISKEVEKVILAKHRLEEESKKEEKGLSVESLITKVDEFSAKIESFRETEKIKKGKSLDDADRELGFLKAELENIEKAFKDVKKELIKKELFEEMEDKITEAKESIATFEEKLEGRRLVSSEAKDRYEQVMAIMEKVNADFNEFKKIEPGKKDVGGILKNLNNYLEEIYTISFELVDLVNGYEDLSGMLDKVKGFIKDLDNIIKEVKGIPVEIEEELEEKMPETTEEWEKVLTGEVEEPGEIEFIPLDEYIKEEEEGYEPEEKLWEGEGYIGEEVEEEIEEEDSGIEPEKPKRVPVVPREFKLSEQKLTEIRTSNIIVVRGEELERTKIAEGIHNKFLLECLDDRNDEVRNVAKEVLKLMMNKDRIGDILFELNNSGTGGSIISKNLMLLEIIEELGIINNIVLKYLNNFQGYSDGEVAQKAMDIWGRFNRSYFKEKIKEGVEDYLLKPRIYLTEEEAYKEALYLEGISVADYLRNVEIKKLSGEFSDIPKYYVEELVSKGREEHFSIEKIRNIFRKIKSLPGKEEERSELSMKSVLEIVQNAIKKGLTLGEIEKRLDVLGRIVVWVRTRKYKPEEGKNLVLGKVHEVKETHPALEKAVREGRFFAVMDFLKEFPTPESIDEFFKYVSPAVMAEVFEKNIVRSNNQILGLMAENLENKQFKDMLKMAIKNTLEVVCTYISRYENPACPLKKIRFAFILDRENEPTLFYRLDKDGSVNSVLSHTGIGKKSNLRRNSIYIPLSLTGNERVFRNVLRHEYRDLQKNRHTDLKKEVDEGFLSGKMADEIVIFWEGILNNARTKVENKLEKHGGFITKLKRLFLKNEGMLKIGKGTVPLKRGGQSPFQPLLSDELAMRVLVRLIEEVGGDKSYFPDMPLEEGINWQALRDRLIEKQPLAVLRSLIKSGVVKDAGVFGLKRKERKKLQRYIEQVNRLQKTIAGSNTISKKELARLIKELEKRDKKFSKIFKNADVLKQRLRILLDNVPVVKLGGVVVDVESLYSWDDKSKRLSQKPGAERVIRGLKQLVYDKKRQKVLVLVSRNSEISSEILKDLRLTNLVVSWNDIDKIKEPTTFELRLFHLLHQRYGLDYALLLGGDKMELINQAIQQLLLTDSIPDWLIDKLRNDKVPFWILGNPPTIKKQAEDDIVNEVNASVKT